MECKNNAVETVKIIPYTTFMMQRSNDKKTGFTLIELLVVISIIALLVAIMVPVLNRARNTAYEKVCSSNLRQVNLALVMYADENNDRYPLEPTEHNPHPGLLKKIGRYNDGIIEAFYCPQAHYSEKFAADVSYVPTGAVDSVIDTPENRLLGNISYIYWSFQDNKMFGDKVWRDPEYYVPRQLTTSGVRWLYPGRQTPRATTSNRWVASDFFRKKAPFPHGRKSGSLGGGLNVVFLDGHVELVTGRPRDSYR
jgi:prepilin-type N-terminal cleavage/methylation domain-containing protein/prepilin-type processing-associated H-X9-DG protein